MPLKLMECSSSFHSVKLENVASLGALFFVTSKASRENAMHKKIILF